jgi:hypothetical protein
MQTFQAKRMALRVPLSLPVRCQLADNKELGGKAINLSTGGISLNTNSPIKTKEQLAVELQVPDTLNPVSLSGEVVWSQFNYVTSKAEDTLFAAGIKFLKAERPLRELLLDCLLNLFWKEYLFGFRDIQELLPDVQNLAVEERRIVIHNYNFCLLFVERRCPHQRMMERALLIPQILSAHYRMKCQDICWYCSVHRERLFSRVRSA